MHDEILLGCIAQTQAENEAALAKTLEEKAQIKEYWSKIVVLKDKASTEGAGQIHKKPRLVDANKIIDYIMEGLNSKEFGHDAIEILGFIEFMDEEK